MGDVGDTAWLPGHLLLCVCGTELCPEDLVQVQRPRAPVETSERSCRPRRERRKGACGLLGLSSNSESILISSTKQLQTGRLFAARVEVVHLAPLAQLAQLMSLSPSLGRAVARFASRMPCEAPRHRLRHCGGWFGWEMSMALVEWVPLVKRDQETGSAVAGLKNHIRTRCHVLSRLSKI